MIKSVRNYTLLVLVLVLLVLSSGCLKVKDSPAPGCVKYLGPAPFGGCFGKSVITDFRIITPIPSCLSIGTNNCNGGVLEISNSCNESLVLGEVKIEPSERYVGLDISNKEGGRYLLNRTEGNFAKYIPQNDEQIVVFGMLGMDWPVEIQFTKTKNLC